MWDNLWLDARLATMADDIDAPYGAIQKAALAVKDGRIAWLGPQTELDGAPEKLAKQVHWIDGRWITPGLIDCHTHIVFGGNRAREFEMRLEGASYEELAKAGGGILSTVRATREAEEDALYNDAVPRLKALMAEGVTTLEIKSGYGLERDSELKQLRVARRLGRDFPVEVATSFLAAHALPPEYKDDPDGYIDAVVQEMLPAAVEAGLADAVDAFCEKIAFTPQQTARVFDAAQRVGLPVKLHADQLSDLGGAGLAADYGGLSADHVEYTSDESVRKMATAGTVATLLPGAFYCLRETQQPPVQTFRDAGVPMAVATDCNPGSAPVTSILLMLSMACTFFRLTPEEALAGVTRNSAKALGRGSAIGTLEIGKQADLCIWDVEEPAELAYRVGFNPLAYAVKAGQTRS